ncbi:mechanosensitive ion channel domain-containing protein [Roseivirga sp.]|uniref:mechanosensitive ion channel domain-containing protein n=1 Tax=Roseivirga sp. TaxID=1964215 RepID=UPI003B8B51FD
MTTSTKSIEKRIFNSMSNLGSGLLLKILSPFTEGDFIEIDDELGSVKKSGWKFTTIEKISGGELKLQNTVFFKKQVKNLTDKNITCLELSIGIGYESNMKKAKEEILNFFSHQERLLDLPKPKIHVSKINSNFVELTIKPWCAQEDFLSLDMTLQSDLKQYLVSKSFVIENQESVYDETKMLA